MFWFEITVAASALWLLRAWLMPYADCRRCGGRKANLTTRVIGGKRFGPCGACDGSGSRMVLSGRIVRHVTSGGLRRARNRKD